MYSGSSTMRPFSNLNGCAILPVRPVENTRARPPEAERSSLYCRLATTRASVAIARARTLTANSTTALSFADPAEALCCRVPAPGCAPGTTSSGTHPNTNAGHAPTPFRAHTSHTNRTAPDPSKSPGYHASSAHFLRPQPFGWRAPNSIRNPYRIRDGMPDGGPADLGRSPPPPFADIARCVGARQHTTAPHCGWRAGRRGCRTGGEGGRRPLMVDPRGARCDHTRVNGSAHLP